MVPRRIFGPNRDEVTGEGRRLCIIYMLLTYNGTQNINSITCSASYVRYRHNTGSVREESTSVISRHLNS
jgi:hypothetical protein